jgi:sugar/nucleoside kinase (ribokinase family)
MTVKYTSLGIILDDIVFPDGRTQMGVLGGGGPQTVWGMALAAQSGSEVGMLSGVGHDMPRSALAPLVAMDVDLTGVHVTDLPTARAWQLLEEDGRRTHVWRVDQATSDRQTHPNWQTMLDFYPDLAIIHWGIHPEDPHLAPCQPLRERGILVSIEPFKGIEQPLSDKDLNTVLGQCDIYSPNWREAVSLFGTDDRDAMLQRARLAGGHILVLRMGAAGSEAWNLHTGEGVQVPAAPLDRVIDPVGAGDAYCGAFAVTWHETGDLGEAAVSGAVAASYLLEQVGIPENRPSIASTATRTDTVRRGLKPLHTPALD